jgi:hypothetical protein
MPISSRSLSHVSETVILNLDTTKNVNKGTIKFQSPYDKRECAEGDPLLRCLFDISKFLK